jgi:hypothetical protein
VRVGLPAFLREGEVVEVLVGLDGHGAEFDDLGAVLQMLVGQVLGRFLELEAVDEDEVGAGEHLGGRRGRLEGVRVRALGDKAVDVVPVADDVGDDVRDGRDRGHDLHAVVLAGVGRAVGTAGGAGETKGHEHSRQSTTGKHSGTLPRAGC